jgi:hypothetical protein
LASPTRQRQIALFLCNHPESTRKPVEIAAGVGCSPSQAKITLYRLRQRVGGEIDPYTLCPECLQHSRFQNVCNLCGAECGGDPVEAYAEINFRSSAPLLSGYSGDERLPIRLSSATIDYLRGDSKRQLLPYCLSRIRYLLRSSWDLQSSYCAVKSTKVEVDRYLSGLGAHYRIEKVDKLAILTKALLSCQENLPQKQRLWKDAIFRLLSNPHVFLYPNLRGRKK